MTEPTDPYTGHVHIGVSDPGKLLPGERAVFPGPVITAPEDLTPEQLSTIPNPQTERTATELLDLQKTLANQTDRDENTIIQIVGCVREHGQAGLYQLVSSPASSDVEGWAVATYHDGHFDFGVHPVQSYAEEDYDARAEELDHARTP